MMMAETQLNGIQYLKHGFIIFFYKEVSSQV